MGGNEHSLSRVTRHKSPATPKTVAHAAALSKNFCANNSSGWFHARIRKRCAIPSNRVLKGHWRSAAKPFIWKRNLDM
jgi:hypothetical protein